MFFKEIMLSRIPKPFELSHEWVLKNSRYQEPSLYTISFYKSEKGPFEVPIGRTKKDEIRKLVPGSTKLYVLQERNSPFVFC